MRLRRGIVAGLGLALAHCVGASAEDVDANEGTPRLRVEKILVTAQKRVERAQDVPLSVSIIETEPLLEQNLLNARDYLTRVPGVTMDEIGSGQTQLTIRGISTGFGGNPLVGITIDDVPFGSSVFTSLGCCIVPELDPWLLDRIEVLRGPQGTLYGANAMGGLVKFVTAAPGLDGTTGRAEVDASTVAHGNQGYGIRAALGTLLKEGEIAVQASAFDRQDPGYIRDSLQDRANVNESRARGGQITVAGRLNDRVGMKLTSLYQERSTDGSNMVDIALSGAPLRGAYEHRAMSGTDGLDTRLQFNSLELTARLGSMAVTSLTGYQRHYFSNPTDLTPSFAALLPVFYPGVAGLGIRLDNTINTERWTQELRVASAAGAPFQYVAGLFYSDENNDVEQRLVPSIYATGAPATVPILYATRIRQDYRQSAAFLSVTLAALDGLDIAAGGRYSHNQQEISQKRAGLIASSPSVAGADAEYPTTYSLDARYRLDPDRMLYARVASGYRAGGPNFNFTPGHESFQPDTLVNFELGLKGAWLERQLTLDPVVYYIDWSKIQVLQVTPTGIAYFTNAGKASSKGVEVTLGYRPVSGLRIAGNVAYNDAKLDEDAPPGTFFGTAGDRLPFAARWTGNVSADYSRRIDAGTLFAGATAVYTGARQIDFAPDATVPRLQLPAFTTVDLRFGMVRDRYRATLFVKNAGDKRGYVGGQNFTAGTTNSPDGPWNAALIAPRTVGLSITLDL